MRSPKNIFRLFGPQFGPKIRRGGGVPRAFPWICPCLRRYGSIVEITDNGSLFFPQVLQRLTFDLSHIKIYFLLLSQIPSVMTGQQFDLCLKDGVHLLSGLITGMDMAVSNSYLTA